MLSDSEIHSRYCPIRNYKSALFITAYFLLATILNVRALHRAFAEASPVRAFFALVIVVVLAKWMVAFRHLRERLIFGICIVILVAGQLETFLPSTFNLHMEVTRSGHLVLSIIGLAASITMLAQSVQRRSI